MCKCPYCERTEVSEKFTLYLLANEDHSELKIEYDELSPMWEYICLACGTEWKR